MGSLFNAMHMRLVAALQDVQLNQQPILTATDGGIKRSSDQRSGDIMSARYWLWSVFRVANPKLFFTEIDLAFVGTGGIGYADVTGLNMTNIEDMTLQEISALYRQPITIVNGDELGFFLKAKSTSRANDLVAGVVALGGAAQQTMRIKLIAGNNLNQDTANYDVVLGYYANPLLNELTAASVDDLTEPRIWFDAIERYAEYLGWKLSGNSDRALEARNNAFDQAIFLVDQQYGGRAAEKVRQYLQTQR